MLLPVSMEGLGACPPFAMDHQDSNDFPAEPVGDQNFSWLGVGGLLPENDDPYPMIEAVDPNRLGKIVLPPTIAFHWLAVGHGDQGSDLTSFAGLAFELNLAIEFQIADIKALAGVKVIERFGVGEIRIDGKIAGNLVSDDQSTNSKQRSV